MHSIIWFILCPKSATPSCELKDTAFGLVSFSNGETKLIRRLSPVAIFHITTSLSIWTCGLNLDKGR